MYISTVRQRRGKHPQRCSCEHVLSSNAILLLVLISQFTWPHDFCGHYGPLDTNDHRLVCKYVCYFRYPISHSLFTLSNHSIGQRVVKVQTVGLYCFFCPITLFPCPITLFSLVSKKLTANLWLLMF